MGINETASRHDARQCAFQAAKVSGDGEARLPQHAHISISEEPRDSRPCRRMRAGHEDEGNEFLGNFQVLAIRPEALSVELLERAARQFESLDSLMILHFGHLADCVSRRARDKQTIEQLERMNHVREQVDRRPRTIRCE